MSTFTLDIGGTLGQVWPRHPSNYEFDHGGLTKNQVRVPNQHDLGGVAYFLDQPNDIYKWRKWRFFLACILSALKFCRVPQKNWQTKLMFHWFLELTHVCCLSLPIWMMNVHWWWMCVGDESALANDWPFQCLLPHVGISMISRNPCLGRCLAWGGDGLPPSSCCLCWDVAGEEPDLPDLLSSLRAMNAQALREAWQRRGSWCFCFNLWSIYIYFLSIHPHLSINPSIHPQYTYK